MQRLGRVIRPAALMIGLGAAALLPIIFFFGVAHMAWRAQELRLITNRWRKSPCGLPSRKSSRGIPSSPSVRPSAAK